MLSICKHFMETNFDQIGINDKTVADDYRIMNISRERVEQDNVSALNRVIYIYIAPIIIGVGVVGDLLTIATLTHPSLKRKDIYIFLTFLAVTDLLAQLSVIPPILWILDFRFCSRPAAIYYAHIAFPMANALMGASVWVVVLLTLYQFRAVRYPLRSSTAQMDRKFVYCLFALSFFANFCIYAPWAFKKVIYQIPPGVLRCPLVICDRNMHTPWFLIYEWFREFLTRLLPFVLIAYFNVTILITYRTNKKDRLSLSSQSFHRKAVVEKSEKEEKRLFTVLFAITAIFFLCTIPAAPVTIFISDRQSQSLPFQIFRSASNLLEITKFALNFYLYCLINPEIRRVCLRRVLKCSGWSSVYERVSSGQTLKTLPNSRSGSNKTILTIRNGSDRSSRGSRRSRNSHLTMEESQRIGAEESQRIGAEESQRIGAEESQRIGTEESQRMPMEENQRMPMEDSQEIGMRESQRMAKETSQRIALEASQKLRQMSRRMSPRRSSASNTTDIRRTKNLWSRKTAISMKVVSNEKATTAERRDREIF